MQIYIVFPTIVILLPKKKRETPTDLYFNILLTNLDVADCEVKIRGIVFFKQCINI